MKNFLRCLFFMAAFLTATHAQTDPAASEDAAIERQRMMKAVDQIEIINDQIRKMQDDLRSSKQDIESLRTENYKLKQQLALSEARRAKERDIILAEVAKSIAKVSKTSAPSGDVSSHKSEASSSVESPKADKNEKGYEHIVEKGQTLWLISKAYKEKGVNVSVEDIRKANNMKPNTPLKVGQKLFIPAK
ncbi:MAG: LysM peptidoglycan-binding domain-containing protein [Verrucomicrobiota bacterium]